MFYRVFAELLFKSQDEANDFYHDCEIALPKSETINPGGQDEKKGLILLCYCYHDEHPGKECVVVQEQTSP